MPIMPDAALFAAGSHDQAQQRELSPYAWVHPDEER
jgi:hypothetical protein